MPVVFHRKNPTHELRVHQTDDDPTHSVELVSLLYEPLYRQRSIHPTVFASLLNAVRHCVKEASSLSRQRYLAKHPDDVADFPDTAVEIEIDNPPFFLQLSVSRMEGGSLSHTLALYDADDRDAPLLYFSDHQMRAFLAELEEAAQHVPGVPSSLRARLRSGITAFLAWLCGMAGCVEPQRLAGHATDKGR